MRILTTTLFLISIAGILVANQSPVQVKETEWYDVVDMSENPKVVYVHEIFNRLVNSYERIKREEPKLVILPKKSMAFEPSWAYATKDNSVVILESLIDLCFEDLDIPTKTGKSRMAFVLAHELAHIVYGHPDQTNFSSSIREETIPEIEHVADKEGLLYMTLAKYDPQNILSGSNQNFFAEYEEKVRKTARIIPKTDETAQLRYGKLQERIEEFVEKITLFEEGLVYYQKQHYEKALNRFLDFSEFFPGREVFNNIGLSYYQLAFQEMTESSWKEELIYRFQLSIQIDHDTLAKKLRSKSSGSVDFSEKSLFKHRMEESIGYFSKAIESDPTYSIAHSNMSSALIQVGRYREAIVLTQRVLSTQDDANNLNNNAVAQYLLDKKNSNKSVNALLTVPNTSLIYPKARYNIARIISEQAGDKWLSQEAWATYLSIDPTSEYADYIQDKYNPDFSIKRYTTGNQKRVALVIGNGDYQSSPIESAVKDAKGMEYHLETLGFEVITKLNLPLNRMYDVIQDFRARLRENTVGLFYFSGHGTQIQGKNYLIPADVVQLDDKRIETQALSIDYIFKTMADARNQTNILILDACRNNPFLGIKSLGGNGLASMDAPKGTLIAYATSPGKVAYEGDSGDYSLFTSSILDHIMTPGIEIETLFKKVRDDVNVASNQRQKTWESTSLTERFVFNPLKENLTGISDRSEKSLAVFNVNQEQKINIYFRDTIDPDEQNSTYQLREKEAENFKEDDPNNWKHYAGLTIGAVALWGLWDSNRNYQDLKTQNNNLYSELQTASGNQTIDILKQIENNNTKLDHYQQLNLVSLSVLSLSVAWELYLFYEESQVEKEYSMVSDQTLEPSFKISLNKSNSISLNSTWRF